VSAEALVTVEGLRHAYGAVVAVDGLSFEVRRGEMFGLIGPDGAGKTTTLRIVLGLLAPLAGRVTACGLSPRRQRQELSSRVGYLSQRFSLYGDLTVDENIAFFADIHGVAGWRPRRDALLEMVRMAPFRDRLADRLSGGMKQKLALACTLVHTRVDPVSRRDFWRLLGRLQREGLTILLTTPYLDEAERCTRVALLDRGRLLVTDAPDALRAGARRVLEIVATPRHAAAALLREQPAVEEVVAFGERVHVTVAGGAEAGDVPRIDSLLRERGIDVALIRAVTPSLEDVFIERIRAAGEAGSSGAAGARPAGEGS
jgi:ABC-2 type transport system ATP-binding protein